MWSLFQPGTVTFRVRTGDAIKRDRLLSKPQRVKKWLAKQSLPYKLELSCTSGHDVIVRTYFDGVADDELGSMASAHGGAAFGELFERHSKAVYNHCFRRTGSWSTAEDLTSVVFLQAWRRRDQVELDCQSIRPWLLAVANNVIRNSEGSIRRHKRLLAKLPRSESSLALEDIEKRIDDELAMQSILIEFNNLKVKEREIISLCDWSELNYAEVAIVLKIPIGTVRSRLARAREHLRNQLHRDGLLPLAIQLVNLEIGKDSHDSS